MRQVAEVFAHFVGAGGAVQADHVDAERLQGGEGRPDFRPEQHGAGGFHGDVADDGQAVADLGEGLLAAVDGGLDLEEILGGFDEDAVRSPINHAQGCFPVVGFQIQVRGVPKGGQFRAGPHGAEHEAAHAIPAGAELVGDGAGDAGAFVGEFLAAVGNVVVGKVGEVTAERVGFYQVRPRGEIGTVNLGHHVRAGVIEDFVTAFQAEEIRFDVKVEALQLGAHGAVANEDATVEGVEEVGGFYW